LVFNSQVFDGTQAISVPELLDALNTMPFASPLRMVSIQDIDKAVKAVSDALIDYLADPLQTTVLVLTATKIKSDSRLLKAIKKISSKAVIASESKKRNELPNMVREMAKSYQISLNPDAASELIELVGTSTISINTELQKLSAYLRSSNRSNASRADVLAVVARAAESSPWDFVEAFSRRDLITALELLNRMPGESPIALISLCVMRIRELLLLKSLQLRKSANLAGVMKKPEWQVKKLMGTANNFTTTELREFLATAANIDMQMKSGKDPQQQLSEFLLRTCK
jgi:DNA polymerase-3 subunit delta